MSREGSASSVSFANATKSGVLDLRGYAGGVWLCPTGWSAGAVTFEVAEDSDGTFAPLNDEANAPVTITPTAGTWHPIPEYVMMSRAAKFVVAGAITATILVALKA